MCVRLHVCVAESSCFAIELRGGKAISQTSHVYFKQRQTRLSLLLPPVLYCYTKVFRLRLSECSA